MVALYLAHEVEEEDSSCRVELIREAFGSSNVNLQSFKLFMKRKEQLWRSMNYNVIVKREESLSVMNRVLRGNYIWRRERTRDRILFINQRMVSERRRRQVMRGYQWNCVALAKQIVRQNQAMIEDKNMIQSQKQGSQGTISSDSSQENLDTVQSHRCV